MGQGGARQGDGDHVLLGGLDALADGLGNFGGLAQAVADLALAVAHDHQGGEFHNPAALHGLGNAVQVYDFFDILALLSLKSRH
jgi:hypothetical protein